LYKIRDVLSRLPSGIWALGLVSLFMDISSELVHSLLPVFMVTVLGASMVTIGVIEGVAEATAAITRVLSGVLSDVLGKRKLIALFGYGISAISKPIFPLATSIGWVFFARFLDRLGKGIRGAPRDALVADIAPDELRGAAYGLRQAMDSVGAFIGPLLAVAFMFLLTGNISAVLWIAVTPACISVIILAVGVHDPKFKIRALSKKACPITWADIKQLELNFWLVVLLGSIFSMARFSEAFLVLRAENIGIPLTYVPMIMVVMSLTYAMVSFPAGIASDLLNRRVILVAGLLVLVLADIQLAIAGSPWTVFSGAALWGIHMGLTQGLLSKLVVDSVSFGLRGTAFGIFSLVGGLTLLMASIFAGLLWDRIGPPATFIAGAVFAFSAATGIFLYKPGQRHFPDGEKE